MSTSVQTISESTYPTSVFESHFTGEEPFFADHVLMGKRLMPGMGYLEMSRAALVASVEAEEDYRVVLSECVFLQPLMAETPVDVTVKVYPGGADEFGIEVLSAAGAHFQCRATAVFGAQAPAPLDLHAMRQEALTEGPSDVYDTFRELGLDCGPSHRGIKKVWLAGDYLLADLKLPNVTGGPMALNPGMLDSAIQTGFLLGEHSRGFSVPFAIKRVEIVAPLQDDCVVYATRRDGDVGCRVTTPDGTVLVAIDGFSAREIDLNRGAQTNTYAVQWVEGDGPAEQDAGQVELRVDAGEFASYEDLVLGVVERVQPLLADRTTEHCLVVQLPDDKPHWRGVLGLLNTVSNETTHIRTRLEHKGQVIRQELAPLSTEGITPFVWPSQGTCLITGGAGGLGLLLAQDIAQRAPGLALLLTGRREADASLEAALERVRELGATVRYAQCDVSDEGAVRDLVASAPDLSAVVHCAGLLRDAPLAGKSMDDVQQVLAPKVAVQLLDEATRERALECFVAFSSISSVLGSPGQCDYAAGNGFLDSYIALREQWRREGERQGRAISINWPLWSSDGMQIDEATMQNMRQALRLEPLPADLGLQTLHALLATEGAQACVLHGKESGITRIVDRLNGVAVTKSATSGADGANDQGADDDRRGLLRREVLREIKHQAGEHLKINPDQMDEEADWAEFGFDSIMLSGFVNKLNNEFDIDLMPTALFDATNMSLFADYLCDRYAEQMAGALLTESAPANASQARPEPAAAPPKREPLSQSESFAQGFRHAYARKALHREQDIAIVGMSCRVAGARNVEEFWELLEGERDMIQEIPSDRWNWREYPEAAKWGSFIDGVDEFDPLFFGIAPAEAIYMAPEQRLLMESVWDCLANAGCGGDVTRGSNMGIFVGCGPSSYANLLRHMPVESYSSTGIACSVGPNRVSYLMDWHGPSEPVETACSSSLVAVHRAVEAIRGGHCDQALAGGVNCLLGPETYISFSKAGMLSADGRCKTFSSNANGYVRGEGVGMVMLRPIEAALDEGNVIHAVIRGTAENHGGRTNSLTAPNPRSQAAVIGKALSDADVDFSQVSYIECHGTGTELGDPVEIEGLKMVASGDESAQAAACKLGSIKSNIGHLEMAAGIAGLLKVVLQMQHRRVARSLHCESLNPYINLNGSAFEIAQQASDWNVPKGQPRVAGVSSFGFGGVNSHVVLQEYVENRPPMASSGTGGPQLLVVSARSKNSLLEYLKQYPDYLRRLPQDAATLQRLAFTLQTGRAESRERVAFVADSIEEWISQVEQYVEQPANADSRVVITGSVGGSGSSSLEIGDTKAGREYLQQLMDNREYRKLAELWVNGCKINWDALWS